MVKQTFVVLCLMISLFTISQAHAQLTFGIKGGYTHSKITHKNDFQTFDSSSIPGFHIGGSVDILLKNKWSIESGLLVTTRGFKTSSYVFNSTTTVYYLQVPATIKYHHDVGNMKLFARTGPHISVVGFSLKSTAVPGYEVIKEPIPVEDSTDATSYSGTNFGWILGVGVGIKSFQFEISYDLGLSNISSYTQYGTVRKATALNFSVGYLFGKH